MCKFRFMFFNIPLIRLESKLFSLSLKRNLSGKGGMRILNVAEKNDAAKNIASFLSSGSARKRDSLSKFVKIYEFQCEVFGSSNQMIMTSVSGHLASLEFSPEYRIWKDSNPILLFDAPIVKTYEAENKRVKANLEKEVASCSTLIIWTDCDREGENIGFQIIDICKAVKPNIKVYRAKFSEISYQSVKRALQNLEAPNKYLSDAVEVRKELDLRIGAAFTRFQTLFLKKAFPEALGVNIVSYGSCQFPTLGFVIDRFKEISQFIPEPFWQIKVVHTLNGKTAEFSWERKKLFDKLSCEVLYDKCIESGVAKVNQIQTKPKTKWRPKPLDTVEMQKIMSRKLKVNAAETLRLAEKLYTQGLISYPRTETNIFPKELNLVPYVQYQTDDALWGDFAQKVLMAGPNPFQGKKTDNAHPPIYPIKYARNLEGNLKVLYEYIVRHFLACLSNNAEGLETAVEISIAGEKFTAKGLVITAKNYLEVYPYDKWTDKELPAYSIGNTFTPDISMGEGETTPPQLLTEADLIALMEKHGIGTDATHAEHIETIKSRLYVGLQDKKYLVPRTLGMGLVEGYVNMGYIIAKPELRADLEADLKSVSENKKSPQEVLAKHIENYREVFQGVQMRANCLSETIQSYLQVEAIPVESQELVNPDPRKQSERVAKCPKCHSSMIFKSQKNGRWFLSCSTYPHCKEAFWFPSAVLHASLTNDTCPTCGPEIRLVKFKFKAGSTYLPLNYVGCLCCDVNLVEFLNSDNKSRGPKAEESSLTWVNDSGFSSLNQSSSGGFVSESSPPNCHCGLPASPFRIKKFNWKEEAERTSRAAPEKRQRADLELDDGEVLRCYCALPCKRLTVMKNGPNKGRQFFTCPKPPGEEKCEFFKWADANENDYRPNAQNSRQRNVVETVWERTAPRKKHKRNT